MAERDQALARACYEASQRHDSHRGKFLFDIPRADWLPEYLEAERASVEHSKQLRAILDGGGWPGVSQVGEEAARAAWLIAQHVGAVDAEFQRTCANLLADTVAAGDANPEQLAALLDRVELEAGREQLFGTHLEPVGDGDWAPIRGIADPVETDQRRRKLGLKPWADYLEDCKAGRPST
jgi:hypothetical protein